MKPVGALDPAKVHYLHLNAQSPLPASLLPPAPFRTVLVAEQPAPLAWQIQLCDGLAQAGCRYLCSWGEACEQWHDSMDAVNVHAEHDGKLPPDTKIMTTWHAHETLKETLWYAKFLAHHPELDLQHTLLLHIAQRDDQAKLLEAFRLA